MKGKISLGISGILLVYIVASLSRQVLLADMVSPLLNVCVAGILFVVPKQGDFHRISWYWLGIGALTWALADLLWLLYPQVGLDPEASTLLMYIYLLPNLSIMTSALIYFSKNRKKWHGYQLSLDMVGISAILAVVIYELLFFNSAYALDAFSDILSLALYVFTDVVVAMIMLTMILSQRRKKSTQAMRYVAIGIALYIMADFLYSYEYLFGIYVSNQLSDIMFMLAFYVFGMSCLWLPKVQKATAQHQDDYENIGKSSLIWWLVSLPIILLIMGLITFQAFLLILLIIFIYQLLSKYLQSMIFTELLLQQEKALKAELEDKVLQRTNELRLQSITDSLTGLRNRDHFFKSLEKAVGNEKEAFSILFMDLDRFKVINDIHGHFMGDEVLKEIAKRFQGDPITKEVARLGGDEFALMTSASSVKELEILIHQILSKFTDMITVGKYQFSVAVSIGVARYPIDGKRVSELVKYADMAMYHAKHKASFAQYFVYSEDLIAQANRRNELEVVLSQLKVEEDLRLHYQPQFDAKTRDLIGMEALLRWDHPRLGSISPGEFIPIAEETGDIIRITQWTFKEAMKQIKTWNETYGKELTMGINVSPINFDYIGFFPMLISLTKAIDVKPSWIELEITEHSAMSTASSMEEIFVSLNNIGFKVSIDDFGTGYSSLSYIKRFEIDRLKIAKELIDNIVQSPDDHLIVKAIVMLAKGMGLTTIAEGVETSQQLKLLQDLSCDAVQGYLWGRPVEKEAFEEKYLIT